MKVIADSVGLCCAVGLAGCVSLTENALPFAVSSHFAAVATGTRLESHEHQGPVFHSDPHTAAQTPPNQHHQHRDLPGPSGAPLGVTVARRQAPKQGGNRQRSSGDCEGCQ